ncbi:MobF family relaxase [Georgenia yuyongxinii]
MRRGWIGWTPVTSESMGTPRLPGDGRRGSPRFAEMVVNAPKSLSIAAALHPEVSEALDAAQQDAVAQIQAWLAQHSVTRVGPRGKQEVVRVEALQTVAVSHRTSRAGDPHRHVHLQVGTRVWAAGKWRALDTAALFKQQGTIRALGTAVLAAHPGLAAVLDRNGLTLDPVSGEVVELEAFNPVVSKRGEQVGKNLERLEGRWERAHPGETMGPVVSTLLQAEAWAHGRPAKKPTTRPEELAWTAELREAGYDPAALRRPVGRRAAVSLDELRMQEVASRALDRCAAGASAWTRHAVQEQVARIVTAYGVRAAPVEVAQFTEVATRLALEDCFSILPPGAPAPEHVAHYTSLRVIQAETELRDLLIARIPPRAPLHPDVREHTRAVGWRLDAGQVRAAAAVASTDPLVIVEGAAGAGKTTMLAVAIAASKSAGRGARVVAPTKKAAEVATQELGVPAESVAALVYAHGFRWNADGVWMRLAKGDRDPDTGRTYRGPPRAAHLGREERVIVDKAGMLDQDTALALFTVCAEAGATVALVGDRAQLPAVGRGGVLDTSAHIRGATFDMAEVHRFTDPAYAALIVHMRDGHDPATVFDRLHELGLIQLHPSHEEAREDVAVSVRAGDALTVSTNDEARALNDRIREERVRQGVVDDTATTTGSDGLAIGHGDLVQTRQNDSVIGVANRQTWIVQHVESGMLWVREARNDRKHQRTVVLPAEYVAAHTHLAYATTAYGVQGSTVTGSHTILTDTTSAAAVYVGTTRGRERNQLDIIAESLTDARAQFLEAMERDRADRGLEHAALAAQDAVRGLVEDGPARLVNTEITALTERANRAEWAAATWEQIATRFERQGAAHRDEVVASEVAVQEAEAQAVRVRARWFRR